MRPDDALGSRLVFREARRRTPADEDQLNRLSVAVYPLEDRENWSGRTLEWSLAEFDVLLFDEKGTLTSYAGVVLREGLFDDRPVFIGGVGGVKTHPADRGKGYAAQVMAGATRLLAEKGVEFGLLVCESALVEYYTRLGWAEFHGILLTLQKGASVVFEFNHVMVLGVGNQPPSAGVIDLRGPPW